MVCVNSSGVAESLCSSNPAFEDKTWACKVSHVNVKDYTDKQTIKIMMGNVIKFFNFKFVLGPKKS